MSEDNHRLIGKTVEDDELGRGTIRRVSLPFVYVSFPGNDVVMRAEDLNETGVPEMDIPERGLPETQPFVTAFKATVIDALHEADRDYARGVPLPALEVDDQLGGKHRYLWRPPNGLSREATISEVLLFKILQELQGLREKGDNLGA